MRWFKKIFAIEFTIKAYLGLGLFWASLGFLLSILSESMLFFSFLEPSVLHYGRLKPLSSLILVFGAFLNFVLGLSYYVLDKQIKLKPYMAAAAFTCLKLHHLGLLLGLISIALGFNKGREFGEMPWLADNLFVVAFLAFPILAVVSLVLASKKISGSSLLLLLAALTGGLASYILGNFTLPSGLLSSAFPFTGIQDTVLQELYHGGLLYFVTLASLFGLLYYFIPLYYKTELYSASIPFFVVLSLLFLSPLAAAAGLVYTTAAPWLQSVGIFSAMALNFAIMAGALNASYTITRSAKKFHSDAIGVMLRAGIFFLFLSALARVLLAPRFVQAWFTYTSFDPSDLIVNIKSYGLMITVPLALVVLQTLTGKAYNKGMLRWLASFWIIGTLLLYLGNLGGGIAEYLKASALNSEGTDLLTQDWEDIFFSGSLLVKGTPLVKYLLGFRGLSFVGNALLALGILLIGIYVLVRALTTAKSAYKMPDLEYKQEEGDTAKQASTAAV